MSIWIAKGGVVDSMVVQGGTKEDSVFNLDVKEIEGRPRPWRVVHR